MNYFIKLKWYEVNHTKFFWSIFNDKGKFYIHVKYFVKL